tara:strand:- start:11700 stop:12698 length:999 start_codon:yes stop_codon:yes gene_type:complete
LNSTKKLHFKDIFSELFASLFAYDSRLALTLRNLLFKPGKISKDYVEGKRMRYANPFRFYLSVSIVFFLLSGLLNKISEYADDSPSGNTVSTSVKETDSEKKSDSEIEKELAEDKIITFKTGSSVDTIRIAKSDKPVAYYTEAQLDSLGSDVLSTRLEIYNDYHLKNKEERPHEALTKLQHETGMYNKWLYKKVIDYNFFKENPGFAYNFFISKLPIVIFLFLPVFTFFIMLLYIRKGKYTYMEQLVFAFHVQSLLFVLLIISALFDFLFNSELFTSIALLLFVIYLYKAMRRFYEQGRFKTFVKFMILNGLFTILAMFAAVVYAFLSFSLY